MAIAASSLRAGAGLEPFTSAQAKLLVASSPIRCIVCVDEGEIIVCAGSQVLSRTASLQLPAGHIASHMVHAHGWLCCAVDEYVLLGQTSPWISPGAAAPILRKVQLPAATLAMWLQPCSDGVCAYMLTRYNQLVCVRVNEGPVDPASGDQADLATFSVPGAACSVRVPVWHVPEPVVQCSQIQPKTFLYAAHIAADGAAGLCGAVADMAGQLYAWQAPWPSLAAGSGCVSTIYSKQFPGHSGYIYHVLVDPGTRQIATVSDDRTLALWRMDDPTSEPIKCWGHASRLWSVCKLPGAQGWATCAEDATVRLWEPAGQLRGTLRGHAPLSVRALASRGSQLLSGGDDGIVRAWDISVALAQHSLSARHAGIQQCAKSCAAAAKAAAAAGSHAKRTLRKASNNAQAALVVQAQSRAAAADAQVDAELHSLAAHHDACVLRAPAGHTGTYGGMLLGWRADTLGPRALLLTSDNVLHAHAPARGTGPRWQPVAQLETALYKAVVSSCGTWLAGVAVRDGAVVCNKAPAGDIGTCGWQPVVLRARPMFMAWLDPQCNVANDVLCLGAQALHPACAPPPLLLRLTDKTWAVVQASPDAAAPQVSYSCPETHALHSLRCAVAVPVDECCPSAVAAWVAGHAHGQVSLWVAGPGGAPLQCMCQVQTMSDTHITALYVCSVQQRHVVVIAAGLDGSLARVQLSWREGAAASCVQDVLRLPGPASVVAVLAVPGEEAGACTGRSLAVLAHRSHMLELWLWQPAGLLLRGSIPSGGPARMACAQLEEQCLHWIDYLPTSVPAALCLRHAAVPLFCPVPRQLCATHASCDARTLRAVAWVPSAAQASSRFAVFGDNCKVEVHELRGGALGARLQARIGWSIAAGRALAARAAPAGAWLLAGAARRCAALWHVADSGEVRMLADVNDGDADDSLRVNAVAISTGASIASGSAGQPVEVAIVDSAGRLEIAAVSAGMWRVQQLLRCAPVALLCVCALPRAAGWVAGSTQGQLCVASKHSDTPWSVQVSQCGVNAVAAAHLPGEPADGLLYFATGGDDGRLRVHATRQSEMVATAELAVATAAVRSVQTVAARSSGWLLAVGSEDARICVCEYCVATGTLRWVAEHVTAVGELACAAVQAQPGAARAVQCAAVGIGMQVVSIDYA